MRTLISFAIRYIPRKYLQLFSHWVAKLLSVFYLGNRVECCVCEKHYRKFLPYGRNARENALCPNCLSLERHRMMWYFLRKETLFFRKDLKVLHIAPELCFIDRFEQQHGEHYISADLESPLAKVKMDVLNMPFEDDEFDVVFCNHVLEHVDDDFKAMTEIGRVMRPGGWGILQVPLFHPLPDKTYEDPTITAPKEREKAFGQRDHVRLFGKDYIEKLKQAGFEANEIWMVDLATETEIERYALPKDEPIFYVSKPA